MSRFHKLDTPSRDRGKLYLSTRSSAKDRWFESSIANISIQLLCYRLQFFAVGMGKEGLSAGSWVPTKCLITACYLRQARSTPPGTILLARNKQSEHTGRAQPHQRAHVRHAVREKVTTSMEPPTRVNAASWGTRSRRPAVWSNEMKKKLDERKNARSGDQ